MRLPSLASIAPRRARAARHRPNSLPAAPRRLTCSRPGFCSAGFSDIAIWSSDDGARLASFDCGHLEAIGLRWSPAAGLLAGGTSLGGVNFFRVGEDAAGGSVSISLASTVASRSASLVHCVAFSADGTRCAAGHADGSVTLIDTETLAITHTLEPHAMPVRAIEFTSSGDALVTGSEDGRVGLTGTSAAAGSAAGQTATLSGHLGFVTGVAAAPGRARFASSSADKTVKLWDIGNADAVQTLATHNDRVNALAWSGDGTKLASVSDSGTLVVTGF